MNDFGRLLLYTTVCLGVCGCEDPKADMAVQPKFTTFQPASRTLFADGASARPLPPGVIPHGSDRTDSSAIVDEQTANPLNLDRETLESGQLQFEIYCAVCHGRLGNGDGMIVERGFPPPPSFHTERLRAVGDGHLFNVMSAGFGAMMSYSDRVAPRQRWEIAAYIRALQLAGEDNSLQRRVRQRLIGRGDQPTTNPTVQ